MKFSIDSKGIGSKDQEEYPVKMNLGCFVPLCLLALIGLGFSVLSLFK